MKFYRFGGHDLDYSQMVRVFYFFIYETDPYTHSHNDLPVPIICIRRGCEIYGLGETGGSLVQKVHRRSVHR